MFFFILSTIGRDLKKLLQETWQFYGTVNILMKKKLNK